MVKNPSEDMEQSTLVSWFRLTYKDYIIYAIANGGYRDPREAKTLKQTGLLAGIPDLCILTDKGMFFIEMKKRKGGVLSKVQKEMIPKIEHLGFKVIVGYGFRDAKNKIEEYLGGTKDEL